MDYTACAGEKEDFACPLRDSCYRYTGKHHEKGQSYFIDVPYDKEKESCEYQIILEARSKGKRTMGGPNDVLRKTKILEEKVK